MLSMARLPSSHVPKSSQLLTTVKGWLILTYLCYIDTEMINSIESNYYK